MGAAKGLLGTLNKLSLLVGILAISLGAYVHQHGTEAAEKAHVATWAALLLVAVGAIAVVLSFVGCCAAGSESRSALGFYFLCVLSAYTAVVAVTVVSAANFPLVESQLENECAVNPWPNCENDLPKLIQAVKSHISMVLVGAVSSAGYFLVMMLLTFFAMGEARHALYYEIRSSQPQFMSS